MTISLAELEPIVREAGNIALAHFKDLKHLAINKKAPRDFVTAADVAVEAYLKEALGKKYPQFGFWGEESGQTANQTSRWVVDPIDGTHSFSKGQYFWAVSVALEIDQELVAGVVYAPALN
ncbi:MAG: inositol monophosphatase, partial [Methylococcales bacterium]|nr:inositol monophosphatase [Methylococcales bacterium]